MWAVRISQCHLLPTQCVRTMMGTNCLTEDLDYQGMRAGGEQETNQIGITSRSYEVQLDISILGHGRQHWIPQTVLSFLCSWTVDDGLVSLRQLQHNQAACTQTQPLPEPPACAAFIMGEESLFLCTFLLCCRTNTLM